MSSGLTDLTSLLGYPVMRTPVRQRLQELTSVTAGSLCAGDAGESAHLLDDRSPFPSRTGKPFFPPIFFVYFAVSPEEAAALESGRVPAHIEAHLHPLHVRRLRDECVLRVAVQPADVVQVLDAETTLLRISTTRILSELVNAEYVR